MREITEKEIKLKQQLLESPGHQKVKMNVKFYTLNNIALGSTSSSRPVELDSDLRLQDLSCTSLLSFYTVVCDAFGFLFLYPCSPLVLQVNIRVLAGAEGLPCSAVRGTRCVPAMCTQHKRTEIPVNVEAALVLGLEPLTFNSSLPWY